MITGKVDRRTALKVLLVFIAGMAVWLSASWYFPRRRMKAVDEVLHGSRQLLDALVDTIIPATDTPGAKQAGVTSFLILKVLHYTTPSEQRNFCLGLEKVERMARERYGSDFNQCSEDQRVAILEILEARAWRRGSLPFRVQRKLFGSPFIDLLKMFVTEGYCMSRIGCTEALAYDPIPQTYIPCIPLTASQRAWATK